MRRPTCPRRLDIDVTIALPRQLDSEPGRGTSFKIYLPRARATVETLDVHAVPPEAPRGSETILLVEDEQIVRGLEREALEESGSTVLEAQSASHALELAQEYRGTIDLLLTDVVMPELSGHEIAERLTARRPEMKVLYASGYTEGAIVRHGVLEPGIAFLPKPLTPTSLARKSARGARRATDSRVTAVKTEHGSHPAWPVRA